MKKHLRKTSRPTLDSKWDQLLCSFHGDDEAISALLSQRAHAFIFKAIGSHPDFVLSWQCEFQDHPTTTPSTSNYAFIER